ncbi:uncharacterized protein LOC128869813 [Anastrepha ludens]|uniref:uncharacterized protein LOC128869813 n=1 Tax=Anastrepha ludens TaxID=28586 RepID=UPI0023B1BE3D|nr:uncharacterized protein LOC128869813 [Anastrepha ludens]
MKLSVGGPEILSKEAIKSLGVMIDTRLSFKQHLTAVNNKAAAVMGALTKILPNIGGPQGERRKLLSTVVDSIILYAAPVWAEAKNIHMREVPENSQLIFTQESFAASIASKELNQRQQKKPSNESDLCMGGKEDGKSHLKGAGRTNTHRSWLLYGISPPLSAGRKPILPESAEHVAFHCDRFARARAILERVLGHSASPNGIVQDMCSSSAKWVAIRTFAGKIMLRLQFIKWERKTQQQQLQLQL